MYIFIHTFIIAKKKLKNPTLNHLRLHLLLNRTSLSFRNCEISILVLHSTFSHLASTFAGVHSPLPPPRMYLNLIIFIRMIFFFKKKIRDIKFIC